MTPEEVGKLEPGLYYVVWNHGHPGSVAAVGVESTGDRWLAPTNWVTPGGGSDWDRVRSVHLITTQARENLVCFPNER